jgi:hypothetical protein
MLRRKYPVLKRGDPYPPRRCYLAPISGCDGPLCVREFPAGDRRWSIGDPFLCVGHLKMRGLSPRNDRPEQWILADLPSPGGRSGQ